MDKQLLEDTKTATYFLWEYTKFENPMELWYCAEDIACYMELNQIQKPEDIFEIMKQGKQSFEYIFFVRNIAFRIYLYTKNECSAANWYTAERLLLNGEWCTAVTRMASAFHANRGKPDSLSGIHLAAVWRYYIADQSRQ